MGPGILPETTVGKHNQPCHLQMPTKALSYKKEAICEHGPEAPSCPVGQGSFKMDISAYGMGSLHVLESTMNAERYIKVLEQHMLPSRWRLFQGRPCVFQQDYAKPHTAAITTTWLRNRRVLNLYQARMGPNSNTKTPETHNLDAQSSSNCFEKKRRCYTMVNLLPSQLFWDL